MESDGVRMVPLWTITILPVVVVQLVLWPLLYCFVSIEYLILCAVGVAAAYLTYAYFYSLTIEDFDKRSVVVTGCDRGFGRMLALKLAAKGVPIYAACYEQKNVESLLEESKNLRGKVQAFRMDVTDDKSCEEAGATVARLLGDKGLWGIVANAGIIGPNAVDAWLTADDYIEHLQVNTFGSIRTVHTFLPLIQKRADGGRIVLMGSVIGTFALPSAGPYCVSKFAIEGYADVIRQELYDWNIRVSLLKPGFYETQLINRDLMAVSTSRLWERLPEATKKLYGYKFAQGIDRVSRHIVSANASNRIYEVIDTYEHALFGRFPHARYPVGWKATWIWVPLSILPTSCKDVLYRLGSWVLQTPVPAFVQERAKIRKEK